MESKSESSPKHETNELESFPKSTLKCFVKDPFGQILESLEEEFTPESKLDTIFNKPYQFSHQVTIDGQIGIEGIGDYLFEVDGLTFARIFSQIQKMVVAKKSLKEKSKQYEDASRRVRLVRSLYQSNPNAHEKEMLTAMTEEQNYFREQDVSKKHVAAYEEFLESYKV